MMNKTTGGQTLAFRTPMNKSTVYVANIPNLKVATGGSIPNEAIVVFPPMADSTIG